MMDSDNAEVAASDAAPVPPSSSTTSRRKFLGALAVGSAMATAPGIALAQQVDTDTSCVVPSPGDRIRPPAANAAERRRETAVAIRRQAAELAAQIPLVEQQANGDERAELGYAFSFTKGLAHDYETGLVEQPADFDQFVRATESGEPADFIATPLGPRRGFVTAPDDAPLRAWESQGIGSTYDLMGPDMQALAMPPAPIAGSSELIGEMAELYAQAVLRDTPLANFRYDGSLTAQQGSQIDALNGLPWFDESASLSGISDDAQARRRPGLVAHTAFRGIAPGDTVGPYVSQLLLVGSAESGLQSAASGLVSFGAQTIDQRVRSATRQDFMTSWDEWFDVQNALDPLVRERYEGRRRFIATGRDLATYVHSDALYQAYLTATLVLFSQGTPLDPGMPFQGANRGDHQQGFVLFGGPHVLSLLAEVCMRALKTVMCQKFNVHRRARPEVLAARIEKAGALGLAQVDAMAAALAPTDIAAQVRSRNAASSGTESMLLPMAYAEGSPMHPSYGAGHGAVAGACATVLKALFDHTHRINLTGASSMAFVAQRDGSELALVPVYDESGDRTELTVEGEVNKLAANIAIGRDWAGVHYFSDYWESMLLGETIAVQILREQMLTTPLDYSLTIPTFKGDIITLERTSGDLAGGPR